MGSGRNVRHEVRALTLQRPGKRSILGTEERDMKPCIHCGEGTYLVTQGPTPVPMCYACLGKRQTGEQRVGGRRWPLQKE